MSQKRIAIYGGSFNPPGVHHEDVVRALAENFDEVIVVPCGPRPDKEITNDIAPSHRATMADLAFGGIKNVAVDLFDLENDIFTPNVGLQKRYADRGIIFHVIGSDLIGPSGKCAVRDTWKDGERLWRTSHFVVGRRAGYQIVQEELPSQYEILEAGISGSSNEIRRRIFDRKSIEGLMSALVVTYVRRYGLYRMSMPSETSRLSLPNPTLEPYYDKRNSQAVALAMRLVERLDISPDLIAVCGGDGTMLRAIKSEWRRRVPFYGINMGHVGFLLNEYDGNPFECDAFTNLVVHRVPLLSVEMEMVDGSTVCALAFNDAYVQNVDQALWIRISTNDTVRIDRMVADTVLVSSPAGSTAYARALGATPMLLDHKGLVIAASAVNEPFGWRPVHLPESTVVFEALHSSKRPAIGKVDGTSYGPVLKMTVRTSRTASAELAFLSETNLNEKRIAMQFPKR